MIHRRPDFVLAPLIALLLCNPARAQDALPKKPESFEVAGTTGMVYAAPRPAEGKPWVWYSPTFQTISFAGKKVYFETFLRAGIAIAGCNLGEVRGAPASTAKNLLFYEEMVRRGYSPKPIVLGQSRGGLIGLGWAMRHPDKTGAFVGIYPVCNLLTWGMKNLKVTLPDYEMTEDELRSRMKEFNPIDNLDGMIKKKVPVFIVHGDIDKAVPIAENTLLLKERYEAGGGPITVKVIAGEGHQGTPSFFECQELIDFVVKQSNGRPQPPVTRPTTAPAPGE